MASLDKISVRNEVIRLKADFEQLSCDGKVPRETQVLMNSMFLMMELMLSIFLERITKKDSRNSSKPSSQTEKDDSSLTHSGSQGKGKDENGAQVKNTRVKERVTLSKARLCDVCGEVWITHPVFTMKDGRRLTLSLRKSLSMWMQRSSSALPVMRRSKESSRRICTARCNTAMA